jgi:ABC-2 type transport system permease protein
MSIYSYFKQWFKDFLEIFDKELGEIFHDSGAMLIFFFAGILYPLMYNGIYYHGLLDKTNIAVVDNADCPESREYIREIDATRECNVKTKCTDIEQAKKLMEKGKIHGIVYFPADYGERLNRKDQAFIYIYADMSSFLYYKDAMMSVNHVMISQLHDIQIERYREAGISGEAAQMNVKPLQYDEEYPYNKAFSYQIFICTAILLVIMQQTMFYGMALISGTQREEKRSYAKLISERKGAGAGRIILARGSVYGMIYLALTLYVLTIVPRIFGLPQMGGFGDLFGLSVIFVIDCVFFSMFWSSFITRRESIFMLFLFMSPICLFLTGFAWPWYSMPKFYQVFSYLLPTTFGVQTFMNISCAGADLVTCHDAIITLTIQSIAYCLLTCLTIYIEDWIIRHRAQLQEAKEKLAEKAGVDIEENLRIIGGEEAVERYRQEHQQQQK